MFKTLLFSMPVQLLFHHLKKNLAILAFWVIIVAAYTGGLGRVYGIHYLFLDPEYCGKVNFWSFFLMGIGFGSFTVAWHITSYILDAHKFRFIGVLKRSFTHFALNNSLIPLAVVSGYLVSLLVFQASNTSVDFTDLLLYVIGFLSGLVIQQLLTVLYFRFTNQNIFRYLAGNVDKTLRKSLLSRNRMMKKIRENQADKYPVTSYLNLRFRLSSTDQIVGFSKKEAILRVFDQNHFNAVLIQLLLIATLILISFFPTYEWLQIPAATSALFIFTLI
ncbi:MAG: patatin-like phospholipase family protein, partial [Bacteroidota bacterium]